MSTQDRNNRRPDDEVTGQVKHEDLLGMPNDGDIDDSEATVMAPIPEELLAESLRSESAGGLRQMFGREGAAGAPPPAPTPRTTAGGDGLLDVLFDGPMGAKAKAAQSVPAPAYGDVEGATTISAPPAAVAGFDLSALAPTEGHAGENDLVESADEASVEGGDADPEAPGSASLPGHRLPPAFFDHEEGASALLLRAHQTDTWLARAEWLRAEAEAVESPVVRSRLLLAISEQLAMCGEEGTARTLAEDAKKLIPNSPLAHRQVRGLAVRENGFQNALELIDEETRVSPSPEARCHGALFGAEVARICLADAEGVKKRLEQAHRMVPSDPRPYLHRLFEALSTAESDEGVGASPITRIKVGEHADLAPLAGAMEQVLAHRALTPPTAVGKGHQARAARPSGSAYESLLRTRASLVAGDHAGVISGLTELAGVKGLSLGAAWLCASIAAIRSESRAAAPGLLQTAMTGSHGSAARRALAARAVELRDSAVLAAALNEVITPGEVPTGEVAFTIADRVALAALAGSDTDVGRLDAWLTAVASDPEQATVASAVGAALGTSEFRPAGGPRARVEAGLGRALATKPGAPDLRTATDAYFNVLPEAPLARLLNLEFALEAADGERIAAAVASWCEDADFERERSIASAMIAEAFCGAATARGEFERAHAADPANEGVARALMTQADPQAAAKLLADHAAALEPGVRAAMLFTEAALRARGLGEEAESEALLRRAVQASSELQIAAYFGEGAARARGDRDALLEWIRGRREATTDVIEQSLDLAREARILGATDPSSAAPLLEAALRARPNDVALRELFERISPEPPQDRVSWRMARAAEASGLEAARLWLEAAVELERSGDHERAARCASAAAAAGDTTLAPIVQYRAALFGHGASDLIESLIPRARECEDPDQRREIYERLAELDERGRGDVASGLLWRKTILEEARGHLPTLRRVAATLTELGHDDELEPVALEIARVLGGGEGLAHAMIAARLRSKLGTWEETREAVDLAYQHEPKGIWVLRQRAAHSRVAGEHLAAAEADRALIERTNRPSEAATLSIRVAESAAKAGQIEDALASLRYAIELVPNHLLAHVALADLLAQTGDHQGAATTLEVAASVAATDAERAQNLYSAAILWQDKLLDSSHACTALEAVAEVDPSFADVFDRLKAIYVADGERAKLAALLKRRLEAVENPADRVEIEVQRGRALADIGDREGAKEALSAALDNNPDHVGALYAYAEVCSAEQDWTGAEDAFIRLARLVSEADRQAAIYLRLGDIYDEHLPNPERAELSYQEILKRAPNDVVARERLVALYQRSGDWPRALEQQTLLVNGTDIPEVKCERTVRLAKIYEDLGDAKKAEATLLQARKTWPKDDLALSGLARFYLRNNQGPAATVLLDRAVADARRALATGRFEPHLFSTVATVAELRERHDAARIAKAAVAALEGSEFSLEGTGIGAASDELDDLLAPEAMTLPFRDLLRKTGPMLDMAVPYDLTSIRATPIPPTQSDLNDLIHAVAAAYGFHEIEVHVSSALGPVCVPVSAHPPEIVLGQPLVESPREDVRLFLIHRALKVLQANAAGLSRTAPIDLWPLVAAYLKALNPSFVAQGVDPGKFADFSSRFTRGRGPGSDPQIAALAAEVSGSIGNRASTLNTVINGWGNRVGLLVVGDLNVAITGIAWAGGHVNAPPTLGKDRITWIGRNAEARELVVFSVSDACADARTRLGSG